MFQTIDVLIGLSVVMLVVSMGVTVLTQAVTSVLNSRGKALLKGVSGLLEQIHPGFGKEVADQIAKALLTHPLIHDANGRLGAVIHREELTGLLMELATEDGPRKLEDGVRQKLLEALKQNGIDNPSQTLKSVRDLALQLEKAHPELSNNMRHSMAILEEAGSEFVAKINAWFDQTIDRVSERFTFHAHRVTFVCAAAVALFLQLDTVAVVNRLSVDDELRGSMVEQAKQITASENQPAQLDKKYSEFLSQNGIVWSPKSFEDWKGHWDWTHLPGILVSALLLSLGGPFWYGAMKNLLQMRSALAQKDDSQRLERQTTQQAAGGGPAPPQLSAALGEKGDLNAAG
jgi:hypothetical protein